MPDAKNNAKLTGDTHLPDVGSDEGPVPEGPDNAPEADGTPREPGRAAGSGIESRPGRGINQAGLLKDTDDAAGDTARPGGKPL